MYVELDASPPSPSLLIHSPEWTKSLNAVRVEAAWRLGKWDELENYLANVSMRQAPCLVWETFKDCNST